ncbi:hypothetical protein BT63DRAFT_109905 [Microthyrium microscopicum]|uniref:AAR2 domain-containing protein n=1 Tax=Microthyrium microscopicum TaxID=703497 RepID=A0A6A6TV35_9PEZI|nr:hypothetical protein BT63DRAFT_109905 [Microthyrium microscopicum]
MDSTTVHGATVLLLNLPPAALAAIDLLSFTTSAKFRGIKLIPPGLHFVFASASTSLSIRHGAWIRIPSPSPSPSPSPTDTLQLFVRCWEASTEDLVPESSPAALLRWRANLSSIWREGLTPYRQSAEDEAEETDDWDRLTNYITDDMLTRVTGNPSDAWSLTSASSASRDLDDIPGLGPTQLSRDTPLSFLPVELKQTWRPGATGRERTDGARDHSWALGELIDQHCAEPTDVLGEMQFCFLMVLTLANYSCLEQWKRLIKLLFTSQSAVADRAELYVSAIRLLKLQLQHCQDVEGGLFDLSDDGAGFLKQLLRKFKKSLSDEEGMGKSDVMDELDELGSYLRESYGWDLEDNFARRGMMTLEDGERVEVTLTGYEEEDESGEYAPTVVDLTDEQLHTIGGKGAHDEAETISGKQEAEEDEEEEDDIETMDARY